MYTGNNSLVNNENRYKILFHAKRAIQELNYDAFKEIKVLELDVCDSLRFVLPALCKLGTCVYVQRWCA